MKIKKTQAVIGFDFQSFVGIKYFALLGSNVATHLKKRSIFANGNLLLLVLIKEAFCFSLIVET